MLSKSSPIYFWFVLSLGCGVVKMTCTNLRAGGQQNSIWMSPQIQVKSLLLVAVFFGGGGQAYGAYNLVVQLLSLFVLATNFEKFASFLLRAPRSLVLLCSATVLFPVFQLIPLPHSIWSALPGRFLLEQSLSLIGRSSSWYSISLAPRRTLLALFALIPPVTIIAICWNWNDGQWRDGFKMLVWTALGLIVLGGVQMLTDNRNFLLYREHVQSDYLYGTFANHNTAGLFFVLAMAALFSAGGLTVFASKLKTKTLWGQAWFYLACVIALVMATILTQSRSAIIILVIVLCPLSVFALAKARYRPLKIIISFSILLSLIVPLLFYSSGGRFAQSIERFDQLEDVRPAIWADTYASAVRFWPVGSGISSFPEVFEVDETLEHVWAFHAGRAHNDYLEIAQEGGFLGMALIAAWGAWLMLAAWRGICSNDNLAVCGVAAGLFAVAMQSALDYPLRNQAILCIFAFFSAFLVKNLQKVATHTVVEPEVDL